MNYVQGRAGVAVRAREPWAPRQCASTTGATPRCRGPGEGPGVLTVQGFPLLKPPYGRITAIDSDKGEFRWQIAHGETPDNIRNNPALKGLNIPRTGRSGLIGVLTTKTLVIAGEAGYFTTPSGQRGAMLARLRQNDRTGSRRSLHARPPIRLAHDLFTKRPAIPGGRHRRRQLFGRTISLQTSEKLTRGAFPRNCAGACGAPTSHPRRSRARRNCEPLRTFWAANRSGCDSNAKPFATFGAQSLAKQRPQAHESQHVQVADDPTIRTLA